MSTNKRTWHVDFSPTGRPERDALSADRSRPPVLRRRLVQDGNTRYRAYSADELIELDSLAHHGRPGHLYG